MTKVIFGNHTALRVRRTERDRIRRFYRDVLGCQITREFDDKDDVRMGDDFHIAFLYDVGDGREADKGVTYAADDALSDDDFLKAIFLELKADDVEQMRQKIVAFGVKVLDVPDPHLYFQAPGGQVFRLVGINEDLSKYEGTERSEEFTGVQGERMSTETSQHPFAYVISAIEGLVDQAAVGRYAELAGPAIEHFGGRFVVSNAEPAVVEGESQSAYLSMVEFPSIEHAKVWYDSREYAEARALTPVAFRGRVLIFIEGVKSPK